MKRLTKILMVTCVAALALAAVAAGASAATFTWSASGKVKGSATTNQVFTIGGTNLVTCKKAATTGELKNLSFAEQHVTVNYSECSATFFGFPGGTITITPATYNLAADGEVHVLTRSRVTPRPSIATRSADPRHGNRSATPTAPATTR